MRRLPLPVVAGVAFAVHAGAFWLALIGALSGGFHIFEAPQPPSFLEAAGGWGLQVLMFPVFYFELAHKDDANVLWFGALNSLIWAAAITGLVVSRRRAK